METTKPKVGTVTVAGPSLIAVPLAYFDVNVSPCQKFTQVSLCHVVYQLMSQKCDPSDLKVLCLRKENKGYIQHHFR